MTTERSNRERVTGKVRAKLHARDSAPSRKWNSQPNRQKSPRGGSPSKGGPMVAMPDAPPLKNPVLTKEQVRQLLKKMAEGKE